MHLPGKMVVRVVRVMGGFTEALCYLGRGGMGRSPYQGRRELLGSYGWESICLDLEKLR